MKKVLVTGGNKGIGRAICAKLLSEHSDVQVLLGCRDGSRGKKAVEDLKVTTGCGDDRLELLVLDPSSDDSVSAAASLVQKQFGTPCLYGIVNNAGTLGSSLAEAVDVNYFGPRRVNDAFQGMLEQNVGRIVNIASASGPMFVASCGDATLRNILANPLSCNSVEQLDDVAKSLMNKRGDGYGLSKALVNAYTALHATSHPHLLINSCTPGFIDTDMTRNAGMGATNPPEKGTIAPLYCLFSDEIANAPSGRYYGSDAVRSPLDRYRGPGDPPYQGP